MKSKSERVVEGAIGAMLAFVITLIDGGLFVQGLGLATGLLAVVGIVGVGTLEYRAWIPRKEPAMALG